MKQHIQGKGKYYVLFLLVIIIAVLTPHIVRGHVFVSQDYAESAVLALDGLLAVIFYVFYRREVKSLEEKNRTAESTITDSYNYIGSVNRKLDMISETVDFFNKRKNELIDEKDVFSRLLESMVVSAAKSDKGALRFIDTASLRTMKEYQYHKEGDQFVARVSNKRLVSGDDYANERLTVLESGHEPGGIKCVFYCESNGQEPDKDLLATFLRQAHILFFAFGNKSLSMARDAQ